MSYSWHLTGYDSSPGLRRRLLYAAICYDLLIPRLSLAPDLERKALKRWLKLERAGEYRRLQAETLHTWIMVLRWT